MNEDGEIDAVGFEKAMRKMVLFCNQIITEAYQVTDVPSEYHCFTNNSHGFLLFVKSSHCTGIQGVDLKLAPLLARLATSKESHIRD